MDTLFNRVCEVIKYLKLNDKKFCASIGFGYSTFKNYTTGYRNPVTVELYTKILSTYVNISAEWLFRGEGEMIRSVDNALSTSDTIKLINDMRKEIIELATENGKLKEQVEELKRKKGVITALTSRSFSSIAADAEEPYEKTDEKGI